MLDDLVAGRISADEAVARLRRLPFADVDGALVDHHRALRQGMPEAVFGPGKTPEQCARIAAELLANGDGPVLLTRVSGDQIKAVEAAVGSGNERGWLPPLPGAGGDAQGVRARRDGGNRRPPGRRRVCPDPAGLRFRRPTTRRHRRGRSASPPRQRRCRAHRRRRGRRRRHGGSARQRGRWVDCRAGCRRADERRIRRLAGGRHGVAGDARVLRQRGDGGRHRQRLRRRMRGSEDARHAS